MNRLSSNITLILSIFFPISWFVFFGAFLMAIWIIDPEDIVSIGKEKHLSIHYFFYSLWRINL